MTLLVQPILGHILIEDFFTQPSCRVCGCTDDDCSQCIEATGAPCYWVEDDLCSRCAEKRAVVCEELTFSHIPYTQ